MQNRTRRSFLTTGAALGCSLAASPLLTPITLASAPWDSRLVVIILRGAMDGIGVVQPYGDPHFASLRPNLPGGEAGGAHDLDGFYALHPELSPLMPLWRSRQLAFAHAVSTPYRDKRSHFDGQDLLEAGTGFDVAPGAVRDGWLNRLLQSVSGVRAETAFSVGQEEMQVLAGQAEVSSWTPTSKLEISTATELLLERITANDPLFATSFKRAVSIANSVESGTGGTEKGRKKQAPHIRIAEFAASRLREETRIAAFSINGWDTHVNQQGTLRRPLRHLAETIVSLREQLGPVWDKTAVLAMTEFGRTARENGSQGTDHGTGGAMLMAGGAIDGGRVHGRWPGLGPNELYAGRDLTATADVRAFAAASMRELFGVDRTMLESRIFPGLDMAGVSTMLR